MARVIKCHSKLTNQSSAKAGEGIAVKPRASSLCAFIVAFAASLPVAAQSPPAPTPGASVAAPSAAATSPCAVLEEDNGEQRRVDEQRLAKQLYDSAQLPQPFHGVLGSNVLPAEGLSRLTIDSRVNAVQQSCVMAFLADSAWGLTNLRPLHFRSVNVDIFKDTSGSESTRIFFSIPDTESPSGWIYKSATLILGAYPKAGGDPIFSFSLPVQISNRGYSRTGGIIFAVIAYLCAALATWKKTGLSGRASFSLNPVQITAGVLGDGSISQLQVFFFSLLVASLLFFLWLWTGLLSNISQDLLMLLGISSVGAVGAKYTATLKSQLSEDAAKFLYAEGWYSGPKITTLTDRPRFADLLLTNNRLDVYKFQMAMFSVLVAIYILRTGTTDLGEVKISETLLYLIGISQGVYVGGKAISERETSLNDRVKSLIGLKARYARETDKAERDKIAAAYAETANAAKTDFEAIAGISVDGGKLRLA